MRRLGCLLLLSMLPSCTETASTPSSNTPAPLQAKGGDQRQSDPRLAARCSELGAIYDRYNTRLREGSGGPDLERLGAAIDCQNRRYAQGIATLENLLQRNRTPYPPA